MFMLYSLLGILIFLLYLHIRNLWVYDQRSELLRKSLREYDTYKDYDTMMIKFWVWDIEKFKKED